MNNTIEKIVESVLIQNRIGNYTKKDLELQLQIHPSYPSFQSITDTLDYFDIDNIAVEIPMDALDQLPKSFISLITVENAEEIVTVIKKNDSIELKHTSLKKKKFTFNEFKEIWIPKVIAVEYNAKQKLISNQSLIQNLLFVGLVTSLILAFYGRPWDISQILFLLLSFTGVVFSFFAVRESLGIQSQAMHQFCTSVGNTNCGEVINNNSGKLFKNFSLADAGIVFFGSISLYQILYGFNSILLVPSLIGIPFILYSIYSQALIVKKWCAVCLAMGSISVGLAIIAILNIPFNIDISAVVSFIMLSSLFALAYLYTKEKVKENKKFKADNFKLNHFKRDGQIYNHLLSISEKIEDNSTIPNEIILGNPNASFKIISLTNPMCGYCKDAFEAYTRVLKAMGDKLQISIRLNVKTDDTNDKATQIALILLEIYYSKGPDEFIVAYNKWFADRTHSKWIKEYGIPQDNQNHLEVLKKQSEWAQKNDLYYTPASLINTTLYPKKYNYSEFFYFMSMMTENQEDTISEVQEPLETE
ncbi:vitamin K epoxide reductase family protein [Aquimarina macrocephali]|uniref:vitamin K epoxide reductase family protein n=1 Tax=Aquimarina macrocephali TaxID=666563 RepID=UPI00046501AF|nr:vitamin K epoxide reductase family protein [Aquimarina macrocephali]